MARSAARVAPEQLRPLAPARNPETHVRSDAHANASARFRLQAICAQHLVWVPAGLYRVARELCFRVAGSTLFRKEAMTRTASVSVASGDHSRRVDAIGERRNGIRKVNGAD